MNEQILQRLRDLLFRTGLEREQAAHLILLMLVCVRRKDMAMWAEPSPSPSAISESLHQLAREHPVLKHAFIDRDLLKQLRPLDLMAAMDLVIRAQSPTAAPLQNKDAVRLPFMLGIQTACDPSLARLIGALVEPSEGEVVYVPWDSTGQFSAALAELGARIVFETPTTPLTATLIGMLHRAEWEIRQSNPIHTLSRLDDLGPRFDCAATFLPLGMRIDLDWLDQLSPANMLERTSSAAVLGIRQLMAVTKRRIVVAVQNNVLFSSGAEHNLRVDLLRRGMLQSVIAMPPGLLQATQIGFSVLVISPRGGAEAVTFIDAGTRRFSAPSDRSRRSLINLQDLVQMSQGKLDGPETCRLSVKELLTNDAQLQVSRYVLDEKSARANSLRDSAETEPLEEFVKFIRPPAFVSNRDTFTEGTEELSVEDPIFEVGAADLPEFGYIHPPGRIARISPNTKLEDHLLEPYDIVLIVKGSVGKVGIVPPDLLDRWVVGQSAIALRTPKLAPVKRAKALFAQLRSPFGQQLLGGIVSGATIQLIQLKELRRLRLLTPDAEAVERVILTLDQEFKLEEQIQSLRQQQAALKGELWPLN